MMPYCGDNRILNPSGCLCFLNAATESVETTKDCGVTPELNTGQCIFYPVKEEEREVLLSGPQSSRENADMGTSHNDTQTDLQEMEIHPG